MIIDGGDDFPNAYIMIPVRENREVVITYPENNDDGY